MTDWIGVLLERLHELRLERETIIVLVSDHGIFLGERGWTGKISVALHLARPRPAGGGASRTAPGGPDHALPCLPSRHRAHGARDDGSRATTPHAGDQPLLGATVQGVQRCRDFGANSHYLRSDRWTFFADNRMSKPNLYDRRGDQAELRNVAREYPDVTREIHSLVVAHAEGRLPYPD